MYEKHHDKQNNVKLFDSIFYLEEIMSGITHEGKWLENLAVEKISNASFAKKHEKCDIIIDYKNNDGYPEKIKLECKKNTPNQTRPINYNILFYVEVYQFNKNGLCYIIPAHQLVYNCLSKRGQHTPDALMCYNPGLGIFNSQWKKYCCHLDDVERKIIECHRIDHSLETKEIRDFCEKRRSLYENQIINENRVFGTMLEGKI
jgi:hypothetical protein